MSKNNAIAWMCGYFVVLSPLSYMISFPPIYSLFMGIFGVGGTLLIWRFD